MNGVDFPDISIISPVYLGETTVEELVRRIIAEVARTGASFEIVLVDDRSPDKTWDRIKALCDRDSRVVGIRLSRNFGQHPAITAGLEHARGRYAVVMDCDLQDNPKYIGDMYAAALNGYDIVFTRKNYRAHFWLKNLLSRAFYAVVAWLSRNPKARAGYQTGSFSMISRKVVTEFLKLNDYHRLYIPLLFWLGFESTIIDVEHAGRASGKSTYSFPKLLRLAVDGIVAQSDRLLYLSISLGFGFVIASLLGIVYIIFQYIHSGLLPGWPSVMVATLLSAGITLMSLGVIGMYLGKTFEQTKQRPLFVVDDVLNR